MKNFAFATLVGLSLAGSAALAQQAAPGALAIDRWDADHDGRVTLAEVRAGRASLFGSYDGNGDGVLDVAELGRGPGAAAGGGRNVLRYGMDSNGDGVVTRAEYVDGSALWLQRMDSDRNGVLTASDFGRNPRGNGAGAGQGLRWNNG